MKYLPTLPPRASWLLAALLLAPLAGPAAADHDQEGVTLFRDVHFRGHSETFNSDVRNLRGTYIGSDRASSMAVSPGCRVTLYRHADFRGTAVTVRHDIADLRATRVGNDEVSSLRVDCYGRRHGDRYRDAGHNDRYRDGGYGGPHRDRGRGTPYGGATVFSDADFRGRRESFDYDDPDLRDNPIRQDTISSIHVAPGCRAVLFADTWFRGAATVVTDESYNLRHSAVGNDRVSSIKIDCRRR